jgi:Arc/MetJ family transcription regulator
MVLIVYGYLKIKIFYLTYMHYLCILIHMRTTLNIDDKILEKASRLTGVKEKTSLVRLGLEALIAHESSKRLAKLGGTEDNLRSIPRRRSA